MQLKITAEIVAEDSSADRHERVAVERSTLLKDLSEEELSVFFGQVEARLVAGVRGLSDIESR